jgi:hypothetical protein
MTNVFTFYRGNSGFHFYLTQLHILFCSRNFPVSLSYLIFGMQLSTVSSYNFLISIIFFVIAPSFVFDFNSWHLLSFLVNYVRSWSILPISSKNHDFVDFL